MSSRSNCDNVGEHKHHVVPKSRGGSDNDSNLVLLCLDCHSKAHDVSFKSGKGVIKEAVKRTKEDWIISSDWFMENEDLVHEWLYFMLLEEEVYHRFLVSAMELEVIRYDDLYNVIKGRKVRTACCLNKQHIKTIKILWDTFIGEVA